ncbi:hypothetical protein [Nocardia sp. CNY236]|uniref:hypothetical protein n=1 Tax=Nocardia sp. CNY236 TaxID=1169152 RepID=UPI000400F56B|nr:hypothetical protein [Nocardia sp. CNY236]
MLDVSYRRLLLDQDTQRLDISRYLAGESTQEPARQQCGTRRVAAGLDVTDPSTSD